MGLLALNADKRVDTVEVTNDYLIVGLKEGRQISIPLEWEPPFSMRNTNSTIELADLRRRLWHSLAGN